MQSATASSATAAGSEIEDLVHRVRRRDESAWSRLHPVLFQSAYRYVYRVVGHREIAEDIATEAVITAFSRLDSFRGEAGFLTWFRRILMNSLIDWQRRAEHRYTKLSLDGSADEDQDGPAFEVPDPHSTPEDHVVAAEVIRLVRPAVSDTSWQLVCKVLGEEKSYDEAAAECGLDVKQVKDRLYRARNALQKSLATLDREPGP